MSEASTPLPRSGPLVGLRAIELGSTVAGPFCARLLATVAIESPADQVGADIGAAKAAQAHHPQA